MHDLDYYLDEIQVIDPAHREPNDGLQSWWPDGWYAVANENGIIAYFGDETDAFRFRLDLINRLLNPTANHYQLLKALENLRNVIMQSKGYEHVQTELCTELEQARAAIAEAKERQSR